MNWQSNSRARGSSSGVACISTFVLQARLPTRLSLTSSTLLYQLLFEGSGTEPDTGSVYQRCAVVWYSVAGSFPIVTNNVALYRVFGGALTVSVISRSG
ncbi:hypothetical protein EYC84_002638 [Monilinia fructicola]|uniref:Uncharacterized protein n=1 Tax=Monilinia fructicola TaxID=38448 RepID=A0A5M9JLH4_MONFR|nr:hypothetical protein EYC84_002638 [Monilinia fructicola]